MNNRIPGVPIGVKLVRVGVALHREHYLVGAKSGASIVTTCMADKSTGLNAIVAPDNVYNVIDLKSVAIPDGWDRDGMDPEEGIDEKLWWWRPVTQTDTWIGRDLVIHGKDNPCHPSCHTNIPIGPDTRRIILKRKPVTRRYAVILLDDPSSPNWTTEWAKSVARNRPDVCRIETREKTL